MISSFLSVVFLLVPVGSPQDDCRTESIYSNLGPGPTGIGDWYGESTGTVELIAVSGYDQCCNAASFTLELTGSPTVSFEDYYLSMEVTTRCNDIPTGDDPVWTHELGPFDTLETHQVEFVIPSDAFLECGCEATFTLYFTHSPVDNFIVPWAEVDVTRWIGPFVVLMHCSEDQCL
jgi:hypothetical protein